ncbi:MAG: ABC transporter ATP-binding protein [Chitinophagaceae bacterium]|nr:ABC transporter ATP-binding protein [Chitinophagaceae bacterium]
MTDILKNTWAVLDKQEKKSFSVLMAADMFISILDIIALILLLGIVQFYIEPAGQSSLSFLPTWLTDKNSAWLIFLFFLFFGIKNAVAYLISKNWYRFMTDVSVRMSASNLSRYQYGPFEEFINTGSATHVRKIGFQPFELCQYILSGIQQIMTQSVLILLSITAIILYNPRLFLLLLIILLPPVLITLYFIKKRLAKVKTELKASSEASFQYLMDALKGYIEANIYNRNDFFLQRFVSSRRTFSKTMFGSISAQQMPYRFIEVFAIFGLLTLIAIHQWTENSNQDLLIAIGAFMAAAYKIIPGIVKIINIISQMKAYEYALTDLSQNNGTTKKKKNDQDAVIAPESIEWKNICFQYDHQPLIHDLSFTIREGDLVGITGESGKGKTTLLNLLLGFLSPAKGTILVNGRPSDMYDIRNYWPFITYVKQQPFLIHDSVMNNITLEETGHDEKRLKAALDITGINRLTDLSAEGLDKMITENGKNISGGQQQRIAMARALYRDAPLIILDEPFNELDEAAECALLQSLQQMSRQGKMIVLVTHNKKALSFCTKIVSLDGKEG